MTDVSLDDLIKKDKQQHKPHQKGTGKIQRGKGFSQHFNAKRTGGGKFNQNDKTRKIRKQFKGGKPSRIDRRDDRSFKGNNIKNYQQKEAPKIIKRAPIQNVSESKPAKQVFEKGRTLKVMGLHPDFTNEDLYKLFATEGALEKCLIEQDNFGRSMTTAIVRYHNAQSAKAAIQNLNQHKVMNSILTVEPYKNVRTA